MHAFYLIGPFKPVVDLVHNAEEYLGYSEVMVVLDDREMDNLTARCKKIEELNDRMFVLEFELPAGTVYVRCYSDTDDERHGRWVLFEEVDSDGIPFLVVRIGEKVHELAEDGIRLTEQRLYVTFEVDNSDGLPRSWAHDLRRITTRVETDDVVGYLDTHYPQDAYREVTG